MKELMKNRAFITGFLLGTSGIIFINIFMFFNTSCNHCYTVAGFPIPFYESFVDNLYINPSAGIATSDDYEHFSALFLTFDIIIMFLSSYLLGLIFKFVTSKAEIEKLSLK